MADNRSRRFVLTYQGEHALDSVRDMLNSEFMGMGKVHCGKDPRVLFLYPFPHITDADMKVTLDELQSVGALTYVEEVR